MSFDTTEVGPARTTTVTETQPGGAEPATPESAEVVDAERYTGINTEGAHVLVASWHDDDRAAEYCQQHHSPSTRSLHIRVIREYGMHDRREAPQYHPDIEPEAVSNDDRRS